MPFAPLTTQIVGSYTKPEWLARHQRMRASDGSWWRPEPEVLEDAKQDAARLALYEQERAGLDLVTDGEVQRAAYDRDFLAGLSGIDMADLEAGEYATAKEVRKSDEAGWEEYAELSRLRPRVVGPVRFERALSAREVAFAKSVASRPLKAAVVGPVTLSFQVADHHYGDRNALILDLAAALNAELRAVEAAGADVLQIDEPRWHFNPEIARAVGRASMARMVAGLSRPVIVHVCYGYAILYKTKAPNEGYADILNLLADCPIDAISLEYEQPGHEPELLRHCGDKHVVLGLLDLAKESVETPEHIARRLCAAMDVVPPERLHPSSDCGMWHLPRERAYGKIRALAQGTALLRRALPRTVASRPQHAT